MKKIKAGENTVLSNEERSRMITEAAKAYGKIQETLGYDWENETKKIKTPYRVAKMFVN